MESLIGHTSGKLQKCWVISWILLSGMAIESLSHARAKSLSLVSVRIVSFQVYLK